jgi:hypothetical protein
MKATLIVVLLSILRLGVPALILLSLGELVRRRQDHVRTGVAL